jgi:hypothetical protein
MPCSKRKGTSCVASFTTCRLFHSYTPRPSHQRVLTKFDRAVDLAYGYADCTALAAGGWNRACSRYANKKKPVCLDENQKEGACEASRSGSNADSYAFVAGAIFFSKKCNKLIPAPPLPPAPVPAPSAAAVQRLGTSYPFSTDAWVFDGDLTSNSLIIDGLAHFGDSCKSHHASLHVRTQLTGTRCQRHGHGHDFRGPMPYWIS